MGTCSVEVDRNLCKGCGICVTVCPKNALELSSDIGPSGYRYPVLKGECIGCRTCMFYCPDFAITVVCSEGGDDG